MCAKHKYIDKYLSKNGKWVYVYSDKLRRSLNPLKESLYSRHKSSSRESAIRPHKKGEKNNHSSNKPRKWNPVTNGSVGYDGVRVRKGARGYRRTEYHDKNYEFTTMHNLASEQEYERKNAGIRIHSNKLGKGDTFLFGDTARKIMDFNDKYGPKYTSTISEFDTLTGKVYVREYERNLFGDRATKVNETYFYSPFEEKRVKNTNTNGRKRRVNAIKHDGLSYLAHHGTKGMKWGVRRYQNSDGSLTPAGLKRYSKKAAKHERIAKSHEAKAGHFESLEKFSAIGSGGGTALTIAMIGGASALPLAAIGGAAMGGVSLGISRAYSSYEKNMANKHYSEAAEYRKMIDKSGGPR